MVSALDPDRQPRLSGGGSALTTQLRDWARKHERDPRDPGTFHRGLTTWTRLHGLVSLEIEGAFASMGIDADTVFHRGVDALAMA